MDEAGVGEGVAAPERVHAGAGVCLHTPALLLRAQGQGQDKSANGASRSWVSADVNGVFAQH